MPHSRPWSLLTDAEYALLAPHLPLTSPGRPIAEPRARLDAIFQAVTSTLPWRQTRSAHARTDTVHRTFRRWAHAGVWSRLLKLAARKRAPKTLRRLIDWLSACHRRTYRILGLPVLTLARRLNLPQALPGPSWMLPDPNLSEMVHRAVKWLLTRPLTAAARPYLRTCIRLLRTAEGRRRIHPSLIPA
ncbi:transposase [Roseomonas nepalensis]|uniref:Transposase n=1 Tax=Muricoccus nepalensis TaxID=1854500 RepID=A0A502EWH4_9PROT|nr:transposase [Roseomonas nepalensis]TPG41907.1 transposase [Roseomonas nepalensis]